MDTDARHPVPLPKAWSFPPESTAELSRRLAAAGDGARLVVEPYQRDGLTFLWLRVVPVADSPAVLDLAQSPDINESHPCPPWTDCSGGG